MMGFSQEPDKARNLLYLCASISVLFLPYVYLKAHGHDYELVQLGEMRRDQYLIDKKTGRNWVNVCTGEVKGADCVGDTVWEERLVVDLNGFTYEEYRDYLDRLSQAKAAKKDKK